MEIRTKLEKIYNNRIKVIATYSRSGKCKVNYKVKTILLLNVTLNGKVLTDHVWIDKSEFNKINFSNRKGDKIQFVATVDSYYKKDENGNIVKDYCLTNIKYPKWI